MLILSKEQLYQIGRCTVWFFEDKLPSTSSASGKTFVVREEQIEMAQDIVEALRLCRHIVVEASVGTGKSYAYLVPLLIAKQTHPWLSIVISTGTIALQEQLVHDIRELLRIMGMEGIQVVLAKGKNHFLCQKRLVQNNAPDFLAHWYTYSLSGDRAEIERKLASSVDDWDRYCVDDTCESERCRFYHKCWYMHLRHQMRERSNIIITNHDQLVADSIKRSQLGTPLFADSIDIVVIDEAHKFEERTLNVVKKSWTLDQVEKLLDRMLHVLRHHPDYQRFARHKEYIGQQLSSAFKATYESCVRQMHDVEGDYSIRFRLETQVIDYSGVLRVLKDFINTMEFEETSDTLIEQANDLYDFLHSMRQGDNSEHVFWAEIVNETVSYNSIPKDLGRFIRTNFFRENGPTYIMTSATITNPGTTVQEQYRYFIKTMGLEDMSEKVYLADPKPSPFDYDKNTLLYISGNLPHPKQRDELRIQGIEEIIQLLRITDGRSLILFTSKEDMYFVHSQLLERQLPWYLLVQAEGSSQQQIKQQFIEDEKSVLLATGSFWEGVDIPGPTLSQVIIFKLPFPVPDPIMEFKSSMTQNPIFEVYLPEMLTQLRQGIGRLIRRETDKGIVSILDVRLSKDRGESYRDIVLQHLPFRKVTENIEEVREFAVRVLGLHT